MIAVAAAMAHVHPPPMRWQAYQFILMSFMSIQTDKIIIMNILVSAVDACALPSNHLHYSLILQLFRNHTEYNRQWIAYSSLNRESFFLCWRIVSAVISLVIIMSLTKLYARLNGIVNVIRAHSKWNWNFAPNGNYELRLELINAFVSLRNEHPSNSVLRILE